MLVYFVLNFITLQEERVLIFMKPIELITVVNED